MEKYRSIRVVLALSFVIGSMAFLFGCGGGSGASTAALGTTNAGNTGSGTLGGTAVKGPVSGGTVTAYGISNGNMGSQLASATTDSQGHFTMNIGSYSGPVMLQLSGGTYIDEATGSTMTMATGNMMTAVVSTTTGSYASGIQMTPLTSMAQAMALNMNGGMTAANIAAANTAVGDYFMVSDILGTEPMNPLISGASGTATQAMKNYGMAIAAMSQYAQSIGMTDSSAIVSAMMEDASDGVMNGMMGSTSIAMGGMGGGMMGGTMMQSTAGTMGLANAMTSFIGSTMNKSGVTATDMQALIDQLSKSSGAI